MLNYDEALEKMEQFMIDSRIRAFCTFKCKGDCCGVCYTSKNACHSNEGRRLKCSYFICHKLLEEVIPADKTVDYDKLGAEISAAILKASFDIYRNPYFMPYDAAMRNRFSMPDVFNDMLPDSKIVRHNINELIKCGKFKKEYKYATIKGYNG